MRSRINGLIPLVLVLVLVGGWGGCSLGMTVKTLEMSGESLDAVGRNFISIEALAVQGCDVSKHLSKDTCNAWVDFSEGFKKYYRPAHDAWRLARSTNDVARKQSSQETISKLSKDLGKLTVKIVDISAGGNK